MAKARPIPGLRPQDAYGAAAAKIITVRAQELADHSTGVLDMGDIERVHDMRVATRRLRAALEVFARCFPKKEHRAALREVKSLADALGERRDRDVAIEALESFAVQLDPADRAGVESLIGELMIQQLEANEALRPYVAPGHVGELHSRLVDLAARAKGAGAG